MIPEIIGTLYGKQAEFLSNVSETASRIGSRNAAVYWESARNVDFVQKGLERFRDVGGNKSTALSEWIDAFSKDPKEAALNYWFEIRKGIEETL